ncbi:MAG: hypothetical protein AAF414_15970 [Pseudomonadota bacterium]
MKHAAVSTSLVAGIGLLASAHAGATEFICHEADGGQNRLGAADRSIVVISRDHNLDGCNFSVGGVPAGGPALWNLDQALGNYRIGAITGEELVYDLLLRASEDIPPNDLATVLLSAGGYGSSQDVVTHGTAVDFGMEFLADRNACLSLMEFSEGDAETLDNGFCGYLTVGTGQDGGVMAATLASTGIAVAPEFSEGAGDYLHSYFVYAIDTGTAQIAAFFPAED